MKKASHKRLTAEQLAKRIGTNVQTVWRYARRGCPSHTAGRGRQKRLVFSLPEVEHWIFTHGKIGRGELPMEPTGLTSDLTGSARDRIWQAERSTHLAYLKKPTSALYFAWLRTVRTAAKVEKAHLESEAGLNEIRRAVWKEVLAAILLWSEPVKTLLDAMPRSLAPRCNSADAASAERVLVEWKERQLLPLLDAIFDRRFDTATNQPKEMQ